MNVLYITNHYLERNIGGPNASKGFIQVFASVFSNISIIYPDNPSSLNDSYIPSNVKKIPFYDHRSNIRKLLDIYGGHLHGLHSFVKQILRDNHYDLIVIDHSVIWASLTNILRNTGSLLVTIHHNVEKYYHRDNPSHILYRIPLKIFAEKAERDAVKYSYLNLTLTKEDIDTFYETYSSVKGNFYYLGALDYQIPAFKHSQYQDANTFIITGALSYPQSNIPIIEFIREYYPIINKIIPNNTLIIAGRNPTPEMVRECGLHAGIELQKNPPEMLPLIQRASYYICPINMGSGQKTRVLDGLKNGLAVLCHEKSAYGYEEIKEKGYLFTYNDKETFEKALVDMMNSSFSQLDVYNAYEACFSIKAGVKRLEEVLKKEDLL